MRWQLCDVICCLHGDTHYKVSMHTHTHTHTHIYTHIHTGGKKTGFFFNKIRR